MLDQREISRGTRKVSRKIKKQVFLEKKMEKRKEWNVREIVYNWCDKLIRELLNILLG